jgi:TatD DNase family protein
MGVDAGSSRKAIELAANHPGVFAAVGHHPTNHSPPDLDLFSGLAAEPRVVAIGEVGLEGSHPERAPLPLQTEWLHSFCELALSLQMPISVHSRDTAAETRAVLAAHPGLTGVMHYFSLDRDWARRFLDLGFHLSFAGLVTRPSREELRQVVRECPADRLLLETDSPFGTPHRRRSPNRPAWLLDTANLVAELRGLSLEQLVEIEQANVRSLFPKLVW